MWTLLLLAATVWSFAHMLIGFFRLQENGAVTRMSRLCGVQASHKERVISVVRCKKEECCCNSLVALRWLCDSPRMGCARRKTLYEHGANKQYRVIMACELYCCLLPQCEALRVCRSSFSDRNTIFFILFLCQLSLRTEDVFNMKIVSWWK